MIKVAIVDDNESFAEELYKFLLAYQRDIKEEIKISKYLSGLDFLEEYTADYDIVFLDIEMPAINGMEVAKQLREQDKNVDIVFLTVMSQYALFGYEVGAADFIVKPFKESVLRAKLKKIVDRRQKAVENYIIFSNDGVNVRVSYKDILYVESYNHYCYFHTLKGEFFKRTPLWKVEQELSGSVFLRSSASFIINVMHVTKWEKNQVFIKEEAIPVSRSLKKSFLEKLTSMLGEEL